MREALKITPGDNVAVALIPLTAGSAIPLEGQTVMLTEDIPAGHKFALQSLKAGKQVVKYGYPIGEAKTDIRAGDHVHVHNLHTLLSGALAYEYHPRATPKALSVAPATFMGYPRPDGRVGVRNEIWILPTVGCVSNVAQALEKRAQALVGGGVEGVFAFPHPYGCSQMGEDQENTRTILADLAILFYHI